MTLDVSLHPCFNGGCAAGHGRVHLPVAPNCNVQCNFCNRKYDCVNESRPGVTSALLSPGQAVHYLRQVRAERPDITVAGIAGPGDPFATPDVTLDTFRRIREEFPDLLLCVASNGLNVAPYLDDLVALGATHLTVTVSAVDPARAGQVYAWVRPGKRVLRGAEAGAAMLEAQSATLRGAHERGLIVKVNAIVIPGVNEDHMLDVAHYVKTLGADLLNLMPLCCVPGTPFENASPPDPTDIRRLQDEAEAILPQMRHCTRCRSDSVGKLGEAMPETLQEALLDASRLPLEPDDERPCVAVASREGMIVNQHLGEATTLLVYRPNGSGYAFVAARNAPPPGGGEERWRTLGRILGDCRALLCSSAGPTPIRALRGMGLEVLETEGLIDDLLDAIYHSRSVPPPAQPHTCGARCSGDGLGCA